MTNTGITAVTGVTDEVDLRKEVALAWSCLCFGPLPATSFVFAIVLDSNDDGRSRIFILGFIRPFRTFLVIIVY